MHFNKSNDMYPFDIFILHDLESARRGVVIFHFSSALSKILCFHVILILLCTALSLLDFFILYLLKDQTIDQIDIN